MIYIHAMGNGSVRAPRPEQNNSPRTPTDTSLENLENLRGKIITLEEELRMKDEQLRQTLETIQSLEKELKGKLSQIGKLQDAIGSNTSSANQYKKLVSVINQGPKRFAQVATEIHRRLKAKEGVSAEPTSRNYYCHSVQKFSIEQLRVRKDSSLRRLITDAIMHNEFLKQLESQHVREMVECMYERSYQETDLVIQEGEQGNHLYVLAEGILEVIQNGKLLGQMHPGTAFGELAILYNCKRTATVKAVKESWIWVLDRQVFQSIMMETAQAKNRKYFNFLSSVSILKGLPEEKLSKIVDCLEVDYYDKGDYIIRQGEQGSTFFIIAKGKVQVTQTREGDEGPQEIKKLKAGEYFGEKALISDDLRSANIIADDDDTQCLVVDRDVFNQMVGTYEELQTYLKEYVDQLSRSDENRNTMPLTTALQLSSECIEVMRLREKVAKFTNASPSKNFDIITTLGMGGFGRVDLVKLKDEDTTFALKCIKKKHVVDTRQQEHVYSEKNILLQTKCQFIVRLYRTFRDSKYVYLLMEVCLGGELWTVLRDMCFFEEPTARFCVGCVVEAFDYLHNRGIIYRDLKPENLLLDSDGYVKMADFGFAKRIGLGKKTWTFCGTPEYVAPEIIMNKGHDFGADYWSLGILVFELLTGNPPFTGPDAIETYNMILKGMEQVDFPKRIPNRPADLIRRLCKVNPTERLGNKKNGINDIRKQKWFQGFDWEGLRTRKMKSLLKRELQGPTDHSHFDSFCRNNEMPPDEFSGWDEDF
ncbi:cGMP-dependent protein kinase 2-like isoform X1 [Amblyraja radiata]|uniref:cGMP-dependent protein kinase 2-like isoform X1 n=1 Tax=Amblyraja radiata TaxID=386614 RepID=UPI001402225A|nr:cGMP-dependent protein kinase 2-like isoform X1 [Amblyraja radiata]XP_032868512.1 cGMP-dependent protein kinase 2-like isoform X1 [Amblyraja radiata]